MIETGKHTVFCPTCEAEVILRRKNFEHRYHELLCFAVILTAGIGFFLYLILKYSKPENTCPNCEREFDIQNLPDKKIREQDISN
ncbi:MAG: LITAF-like zinc ribbon domain-containing protein [Candidatus Lokiarchaeota archaeon]|nr:LITAF-like zinc ribbon domain-containing protein [Candidatus Lokiarchaeota archaeon]